MSEFFDKGLHFLGKKSNDVFVLNIGAMDGVLFDEMIGYTRMYNFKGLYVEPIPYLFDKLVDNIGGDNKFENCAISDFDGEISMITIDKKVIDEGLVHNCFYGMSAVYPPKNGLGSEFDKPTVEKYGQLVKVPCYTFDTVMRKHNINSFDVVKIDAEGHDYKIFKQIDFSKYKPKVVRVEWINLEEEEQKSIKITFDTYGYVYEISGQDIVGLENGFYDEIFNTDISNLDNITDKKITLVTGLWNINRDSLSVGWSRTYDHYIDKFNQLLDVKENMIIFGDDELEKVVFQKRTHENTIFIKRDVSWFKNEFYGKIQNIRKKESWLNLAPWLRESTQAKLEMYNPLVMSKMFLLHDAKILDKFDSEFLFWIDAGITNTVHPGYFTHDRVFEKLPKYISKFSFICFPYEANTEIHGFEFNKINSVAGYKVNKVARGGFFGGPKDSITEINSIYYNLLYSTLDEGYMGTEESIFSIICFKHSDIVNYFEIEDNGLLGTFFEDLKNDNLKIKKESSRKSKLDINTFKVGLYVISFNSPTQFKTLIDSFKSYDENYLSSTKKYLLDNSTDESTYSEYSKLCREYNFEHIKKDNLGICGGRQFISEHFENTDLDYYLFFEDDMFFYPKDETCRNGFKRYDPDLFNKTLEIIYKEDFDFLKLNFTEFFGDNSTQWSWYNVPQTKREEYWPEKTSLPEIGLDPDAPKTIFKNIIVHKGIPYVKGEIYYCNWPQIVSRHGNQKMFLDTKWAHPFEQTWMSHIYQLTKSGNVNPGLLLMTPTEHNRFEHYDGKLRKES